MNIRNWMAFAAWLVAQQAFAQPEVPLSGIELWHGARKIGVYHLMPPVESAPFVSAETPEPAPQALPKLEPLPSLEPRLPANLPIESLPVLELIPAPTQKLPPKSSRAEEEVPSSREDEHVEDLQREQPAETVRASQPCDLQPFLLTTIGWGGSAFFVTGGLIFLIFRRVK